MPGPDPSLLQLLPGAVIGDRYEVVRRIKQGGMGAVYEVLDKQTNRRRGLKMLLPSVALDAVTRERFRREATVSGRVESDHIVETIDAGVDQRTRADFLVMELLRGEDLGGELTRRGRIPAAEVLVYLSQVAAGLQKVHSEGIAHRDLKLENIFVTKRDDGSPHLKLLDFGVAKVFETATGPLQTTQVVGTPLYMAPEQLTGDALIDHRADLYSLGHLAFALLVGHAYWELELRDAATIYRFMSQVMEGASESATTRAAQQGVQLPAGFDAWFAKATAKDPVDRYSTAITMMLGLAEALELEPPPILMTRAADAQATDPFSVTAALPGGDSTTAVVGPRAKTTTQSKIWVITAAIAAVVLIGGIALWRVVASSPTATGPLEASSSETSHAASLQKPTAETTAAPDTPSAAESAAPPAPSAEPSSPPAEEPPAAAKAATPRPYKAKPARSPASAPAKKARPKQPPKPASGTDKPKGGYDPLDEL